MDLEETGVGNHRSRVVFEIFAYLAKQRAQPQIQQFGAKRLLCSY